VNTLFKQEMQNIVLRITILAILFSLINCSGNKLSEDTSDITSLGKTEWQPMLKYTLGLHKKSTHTPQYPFDYEWEEIGPGYSSGSAFGHWDIVHQTFDAFVYDKRHGIKQLNGMIPGSIWMPGGKSGRKNVHWNKGSQGHPPVWVVAVDDYIKLTKSDSILRIFYPVLLRQITWFENERKALNEGFYYNDILLKKWESGMDEGVRFDDTGFGPLACVDATSHVYMLYSYATKWSKMLKMDANHFSKRKYELENFINDSLYSSTDKMYYDIWAISDTTLRHLVIENFWPLISGTIWEFYHPHGGEQKEAKRKSNSNSNIPCADYLGHNPLMAMAALYNEILSKNK